MALPLTNLRLYDDIISTIFGVKVPTPPYDSSIAFNSNLVNPAGLDATYCPGLNNNLKLVNLRTKPYEFGKFRNYDHTYAPEYTISSNVLWGDYPGAGRGTEMTGSFTIRAIDDDSILATINMFGYDDYTPPDVSVNEGWYINYSNIGTAISGTLQTTYRYWSDDNGVNWNYNPLTNSTNGYYESKYIRILLLNTPL